MPHANSETSEIRVRLNGNPLEFAQPPVTMYDEDGLVRVFLPIRELFEAMGFDVMRDSRTQTYSLRCPRRRFEFLMVDGRRNTRRIYMQRNSMLMFLPDVKTINDTAMISAIIPARGINPQRSALPRPGSRKCTCIAMKAGDPIIMLDTADNHISAECLASTVGTISYEILCGIGKRVPRIYT